MGKKPRILVISGGPSTEHVISLKTGRMVVQYLDREKYDFESVRIRRDGQWFFQGLPEGKTIGQALEIIRKKRFTVAFIAMHGTFGEDGRLQAILETIHLPFTGSGVLASALAMDKEQANRLFRSDGFNVAPFYCFNADLWRANQTAIMKRVQKTCGYPSVVKPVHGGSSVGTSFVKHSIQLAKAVRTVSRSDSRVMVQQCIQGQEFTCGVLEMLNEEPIALPPTKIVPQADMFYDYRSKYKAGGSLHEVPARIAPALTRQIKKLAIQAHALFGCRGMSRTDFILSHGRFFVLETNTIPGMTRTSLLPEAAQVVGISFSQLLDLIIHSALRG